MLFDLDVLLVKLNACNEVGIDAPKRWQYTHPEKIGVGGYAEVALTQEGEKLKAVCTHWGKQYLAMGGLEEMVEEPEDNVETFEMTALRDRETGAYRIESIVVDGEAYPVNDEGMVELAFSVFYSRSFEIECREIQENFLRNVAGAEQINQIMDTGFRRLLTFPVRNRKLPRMPRMEFNFQNVDFYQENARSIRLAKG